MRAAAAKNFTDYADVNIVPGASAASESRRAQSMTQAWRRVGVRVATHYAPPYVSAA
jgi:hypothetical protein